MNTKDLMIGDWINLNFDIDYKTGESIYAPIQVTGINKDGTVDVNCTFDKSESMQDGWDLKLIEPIPLTEEILEKGGFKKKIWWKYRESDVTTYAIGDGFHIELSEDVFWLVDNCSDDGDYGYESNGIIEVKYVHELQHILRLCKIEKEIKL